MDLLASVKHIFFWLIYIIGGCLLAIILGEVGIRSLPILLSSFETVRFRQYDPEIGISLIPGIHGPHARGCFRGEISINQWGMRDRERSLEKKEGKFRIALLGDSMIEGAHVRPEEVVNIKMEEVLRNKGYNDVEVLNFGIASIGTTQELLVYRKTTSRFNPDVVILLFFVSNDIMNNSQSLQTKSYGSYKWYAPYFDLNSEGQLVFLEVQNKPNYVLPSWLEANSLLFHYIERISLRYKRGNQLWEGIPLPYAVFADPSQKDWAIAWEVTEKVLALLNEAVQEDGAQLLVLILPEFFDIDIDWEHWMKDNVGEVPPTFSPFIKMELLGSILQRQSISFSYLAPYFQDYRDQHNLEYPYFSFDCDSHFSSLGHRILANAIVSEILRSQLLPDLSLTK